jgi:hypothetical protein
MYTAQRLLASRETLCSMQVVNFNLLSGLERKGRHKILMLISTKCEWMLLLGDMLKHCFGFSRMIMEPTNICHYLHQISKEFWYQCSRTVPKHSFHFCLWGVTCVQKNVLQFSLLSAFFVNPFSTSLKHFISTFLLTFLYISANRIFISISEYVNKIQLVIPLTFKFIKLIQTYLRRKLNRIYTDFFRMTILSYLKDCGQESFLGHNF